MHFLTLSNSPAPKFLSCSALILMQIFWLKHMGFSWGCRHQIDLSWRKNLIWEPWKSSLIRSSLNAEQKMQSAHFVKGHAPSFGFPSFSPAQWQMCSVLTTAKLHSKVRGCGFRNETWLKGNCFCLSTHPLVIGTSEIFSGLFQRLVCAREQRKHPAMSWAGKINTLLWASCCRGFFHTKSLCNNNSQACACVCVQCHFHLQRSSVLPELISCLVSPFEVLQASYWTAPKVSFSVTSLAVPGQGLVKMVVLEAWLWFKSSSLVSQGWRFPHLWATDSV